MTWTGTRKSRYRKEPIKTCSRCGQAKPEEEFYPRFDGVPGRRYGQCKPCHNTAKEELRDRDRTRVRKRDYDRADPQRRAAKLQRYQSRYPEKVRAGHLLRAAVRRGAIVRPSSCQLCGGQAPHAHHDDYSRPLDVRWLCARCHARVHRDLRRALSRNGGRP